MPSQSTILIIEDEKNIAKLLEYNLQKEGYKTLHAADGEAGLELALSKKTDLLILDLMLPKLDGIEICKIIRQNPKVSTLPIVMLTAKGEEMDKIMGLQLGADDYVTKPFSMNELSARIKALLRRVNAKPQISSLKLGTLVLNDDKHVVTLKSKELYLTSKEYDLLKCLLEARGKVLSREDLLVRVWNYESTSNIETRTIDMHIRLLRKKMGPEADKIITVKNVGYRIDLGQMNAAP